jgi:hypothetical protein
MLKIYKIEDLANDDIIIIRNTKYNIYNNYNKIVKYIITIL